MSDSPTTPAPPAVPRIRAEPEDFVVEEVPLYPMLGHGMHTYLKIEKRLATTDRVARALAAAAGVALREVGYAGRKDRLAVTRQWFSVPELDPERARELELPNARVLEAGRHPHRLRVGQLSGNRFWLKVRDVDHATAARAARRLEEIRRRGMPNRFGRQRFGRGRGNVAHGAEILGHRRFHGERRHALLMVSALQSAVFNRVLSERAGQLDQLLAGDVAVVHVTGGHFVVADPESERQRVESFEVSPTGPIFGTKMRRPAGAVAALEDAAMARFGLPSVGRLRVPLGLRVYGARRPLRIRLEKVATRWADDTLELDFTLPAGSYATVLVEELLPGILDASIDPPEHPVEDADEAH